MMRLLDESQSIVRTIVDRDRRDLFIQIGRNRTLFRAVERWPRLEDEFRRASREILDNHGNDKWESMGGHHDGTDLTLQPDSDAAEDVLRRLEVEPGGVITNNDRGDIAVRLIRSRRRDQRFGLGLQMEATQSLAVGGVDANVATTSAIRHGLRLGPRAEQLLWVVHSHVMQEKRSLVCIPDIILKNLIWGAGPYPRNWRRELELLFMSLAKLKVELFELRRRGWQPRIGTTSVLLDHVEFSWNLGELDDGCHVGCVLWESGCSHHHVRVGIGHAFLGGLESCSISTQQECREYEFRPPQDERSKTEPAFPMLHAAAGRGSLDLSHDDRGVLQALISEVTGKSLQNATMYQGSSISLHSIPCPGLDMEGYYVAFNGNGQRAGHGYRIVGTNHTGWLYKAGFVETNWRPEKMARRLLTSLYQLSEMFGLVVAGFTRRPYQWHTLEDLIRMSRRRRDWPILNSAIVRVYGPADFRSRLCAILLGEDGESDEFETTIKLNEELRSCGLTHRQIGDQLGVSRSFISQLLAGKTRWPSERIVQARELLGRRTNGCVER